MAHPQNSPRGFLAAKRIDIGGLNITYNSTAVILSGRLAFSGVAGKTIYSNSTGIRIGTLYVSCNSTGNTTT